jgi:hypothetical protein
VAALSAFAAAALVRELEVEEEGPEEPQALRRKTAAKEQRSADPKSERRGWLTRSP